MLHLSHTNHAVLIDSRPAYLGMLQRAHNYVTWGEVSKETVALMLAKRGKLVGGKAMTEENVQTLGYKSIDELAEALFTCKADQRHLAMQPRFRLHPPKKGYKGKTKKSFQAGGEAGNRGEAINKLVQRMV
jgi:large subunit ribosomal protein L30